VENCLQAFARAVCGWVAKLFRLAIIGTVAFVILPCLVGHFMERCSTPFRCALTPLSLAKSIFHFDTAKLTSYGELQG
jgi:hypothetical protein